MRIKDYPYGVPTKTLKAAITWLNRNKKRIINKLALEESPTFYIFDYPDYWDMPKKISSRLSGDAVDWIQEETYSWLEEAVTEKQMAQMAALAAPIARKINYQDLAKKILQITQWEKNNGKIRKRASETRSKKDL